MARDVYVLSRELMEAVRRAEEAVRQARQNTENRQVVEDPPIQTPEVYIALTPAGGIPALTVLPGTGTGGYDQPGVAECNIYQARFIGGSPLTPEIVPVPNVSRLVYNLSTTAIGGDVWILLVRDKYGSWIADPIDPSSGSSSHPVTVLFDHYTDAPNAGSSAETDLYSDTVPANKFTADGQAIKAEYTVLLTSTDTFYNQVRAYFAGTLVLDTGQITDVSGNPFDAAQIDLTIIRDSTVSVRVSARLIVDGMAIQSYVAFTSITGLDLTDVQILKITGESDHPAVGEITAVIGKALFVEAMP